MLPPGWEPEDGPLPVLMWAYPTEYKSAAAAGQVTDSPYRFVRASAWTAYLWTLVGYAVFDDPSLPIIGEGALLRRSAPLCSIELRLPDSMR